MRRSHNRGPPRSSRNTANGWSGRRVRRTVSIPSSMKSQSQFLIENTSLDAPKNIYGQAHLQGFAWELIAPVSYPWLTPTTSIATLSDQLGVKSPLAYRGPRRGTQSVLDHRNWRYKNRVRSRD